MNKIGIIFRIVVINWTKPIVRIGLEFNQLKNQIKESPVKTEAKGLVPKLGKKMVKYPTKATAIAALVHHTETQYPQATRKAGNSPKVTLV